MNWGKPEEGGHPRQNRTSPDLGISSTEPDKHRAFWEFAASGRLESSKTRASIGMMSGEIDALYIYDEHKYRTPLSFHHPVPLAIYNRGPANCCELSFLQSTFGRACISLAPAVCGNAPAAILRPSSPAPFASLLPEHLAAGNRVLGGPVESTLPGGIGGGYGAAPSAGVSTSGC